MRIAAAPPIGAPITDRARPARRNQPPPRPPHLASRPVDPPDGG